MPKLPGTWFQRLLALPQVAELRRRVEELERAELERETVTAEQIEKLTKLYKRVRLRESRAEGEEEPTAVGTKAERRAQLALRGMTNGALR